jgi:hypothetical protein
MNALLVGAPPSPTMFSSNGATPPPWRRTIICRAPVYKQASPNSSAKIRADRFEAFDVSDDVFRRNV